MTRPLVLLISFLAAAYRRSIGMVLPTACKHYPSCSQYAEEAVQVHGFMTGARLSIMRVLRCHPFAKGGYDPVPTSRG